ncbi:hypothetical protein N9L68_07115 [bacterium]|nr:hypothetical protein [bacterium]
MFEGTALKDDDDIFNNFATLVGFLNDAITGAIETNSVDIFGSEWAGIWDTLVHKLRVHDNPEHRLGTDFPHDQVNSLLQHYGSKANDFFKDLFKDHLWFGIIVGIKKKEQKWPETTVDMTDEYYNKITLALGVLDSIECESIGLADIVVYKETRACAQVAKVVEARTEAIRGGKKKDKNVNDKSIHKMMLSLREWAEAVEDALAASSAAPKRICHTLLLAERDIIATQATKHFKFAFDKYAESVEAMAVPAKQFDEKLAGARRPKDADDLGTEQFAAATKTMLNSQDAGEFKKSWTGLINVHTHLQEYVATFKRADGKFQHVIDVIAAFEKKHESDDDVFNFARELISDVLALRAITRDLKPQEVRAKVIKEARSNIKDIGGSPSAKLALHIDFKPDGSAASMTTTTVATMEKPE